MRSSFLFLLTILCSSFFWQEERNQRCPVIPTEQTLSQYNTVYKGRLIFFCCENCVGEFQSDPDFFVSRLAPIENKEPMGFGSNPYFFVFALLAMALLLLLKGKLFRDGFFWTAIAAAIAIALFSSSGFLFAAISMDVYGIEEVSWITEGLWTVFAASFFFAMLAGMKKIFSRRQLSGVALLSIGIVSAQFWETLFPLTPLDQQREDYLKGLQVETVAPFGFPPQPKNSSKERAIRRIYYRGNDERNPRLFNGGNYRTCTMALTLRDAQDRVLDYGESFDGQPIFLHLEIERAPNANRLFFQDELISQYFLTRQGEIFRDENAALTDRVGLEIRESMQRWVGKYPLPNLSDDSQIQGLVYLCQETGIRGENRSGARFHFGIHYDLRTEKGRLSAQSDLWMGNLYFSRLLRDFHLPDAEWLSTEPIPVIPEEKAVNDPALLGLPQK